MASALVESDYEDDEISATTEAKSSRGSLEESDDDSLAGFEDDLDVEEEDAEFDASKEAGKSNGKVSAKRKRKQPDPTKRKQIRRILRDDELTEVTISAQKEERERLRRLELQRSLAAAAASSSVPQSVSKVVENSIPLSGSSKPSSPLSVDTREKKQDQQVIVIDSDDEGDTSSSFTSSVNCCHPQAVNGDFIEIISSDSEVEIDESDDDSDDSGSHTRHDLDYENSGLHVDDSLNQADSQGRVLVNVNHPADEEDIFLAPQVAKVIKPHQVGGIRFLYDNLVETLSRHKQTSGFGCILAHAMGLGKTLQVSSFIDIYLRHTSAKKVLCIVPINTIQNWLAEFNMWLPSKPGLIADSNGTLVEASDSDKVRYRNFEVYLLGDSQKTTMARAKVIGEWNQHGGVLLMGYELFRLLSTVVPSLSSSKSMATKKKKAPTPTEKMNGEPEVIDLDEEEKHMELLIGVQKALCRPGADLVICDEGHRIKNDQANISQALKKIHTRRRVVLTGYPLQNNLQEYWCMVDFVRPNFLGNKQEFCNMFERPILNGQCTDSTPSDVKVMRYRAHVLHSLLEGFVQRRSQAVLTKCLPKKEEHIILVNMSPIQKELYNGFVEGLLGSVGHVNPIKGFHTCTKIWNHPDIFYSSLDMKNNYSRNESPLTILDDASGNDSVQNSRSDDRGASPLNLPQTVSSAANQEINTNAMTSAMSQNLASTSAQSVLRTTVQLRQMVSSQLSGNTVAVSQMSATQYSTCVPVIQSLGDRVSPVVEDMTWAKNLFKDYQPGVVENGGKIVVLMDIIEESLKLGEKLLIFSQSLSTLSVIEEFLSKRDVPFFPGRATDPQKPSRWARNKSYFRLDGNTSAQERERLINRFNAQDNVEVLLFMLSTRAGCLGINLVGASRVVVFDASWNPCHDVQAVCRVYRYGQLKPVHIYRLISTGTMEKKIYDRQVTKQGMANRIVDELNPEANFTKQEMMKLIHEKEPVSPASDVSAAADQFNDPVLVRLCRLCSQWISKVPFKHDSLLVDKKELKLTKAEKREAKRGYEMEKRLSMQQQGVRAYCPGVIQPVYNRPNHVYVPNPVNPAGPISQQCNNSASISSHQQNAHPYPSPVAHLPIPLASLVRAGVPVTQLGQTLPSALLNTLSTSANTTPTTSTSASKDDVVMIDLDELPSPTKPLQEPILTQGTQPNSDLMRLARNAFPNVSPSFIGLLLNQGNARGNSQENARANAEGTSSKDENKTAEATDATVASGNKTSETGNTADNIQTLRGLLAPDPAGKQVNDESASPTSPTVQGGSIVSSPKVEASPQRPVTDEKPSPTPPVVNDGTDDLASPEGVSTDIERPEARNTLLSEGGHSGEPEMPKSSSPTPPVEKKENTI